MSLPSALVGCYRAHAMASHAQACPDWGRKNIFPFSRVAISVCILFQGMLLLRSWLGVMVPMLWHYTHETILTGGRRYIYVSIMSLLSIYFIPENCINWKLEKTAVWCNNYKNVFVLGNTLLQLWPGVIVSILRHLHAQDCPGWGFGETSLPLGGWKKVCFIPGNSFSDPGRAL